MTITGGCHCGAIRYAIDGKAINHALCHCTDCRRSAGAPMVGWTMYPSDAVKVTQGTPKIYKSSENGRRHFCPDCGTGLFYTNDVTLPRLIDIQSGKVVEFHNDEIEELQRKIAEKAGYKLVGHRLELYGVPLDGKNDRQK